MRNYRVSIAKLDIREVPPVERQPRTTTEALETNPSLDDAELMHVLAGFRNGYSVDAFDDEDAMHLAHNELNRRLRVPRMRGQTYQLSALAPSCCQPVRDENGNIIGHLSISTVTSPESPADGASAMKQSAGAHQHSGLRRDTVAFRKPSGSFAIATVVLGIVPGDGCCTPSHAATEA